LFSEWRSLEIGGEEMKGVMRAMPVIIVKEEKQAF